jgi:hypothetical protein
MLLIRFFRRNLKKYKKLYYLEHTICIEADFSFDFQYKIHFYLVLQIRLAINLYPSESSPAKTN